MQKEYKKIKNKTEKNRQKHLYKSNIEQIQNKLKTTPIHTQMKKKEK